jgi:hypothetical protein
LQRKVTAQVAAQVQWMPFHSPTGLLTLMTSELQRQCRDITDRLAPPTASSTAAVSLQQVHGRGAVSEPGPDPQQAPCWRQGAASTGSRGHRPGTHLSRCMTLPLHSGSGMRCIVRVSCPASSRYSSCCRLAARSCHSRCTWRQRVSPLLISCRTGSSMCRMLKSSRSASALRAHRCGWMWLVMVVHRVLPAVAEAWQNCVKKA